MDLLPKTKQPLDWSGCGCNHSFLRVLWRTHAPLIEQTTTSTHAQCVPGNQSEGCVELSTHLKCEEVTTQLMNWSIGQAPVSLPFYRQITQIYKSTCFRIGPKRSVILTMISKTLRKFPGGCQLPP